MDSATYRRRPSPEAQLAGLGLFDLAVPAELLESAAGASESCLRAAALALPVSRVEAAHAALEDSARRWIDAGKPVAVAVARAAGQVTAETFRSEARLRHALAPEDGPRALSYIAVMFRELVKEGALRKRVRADGSAVKVFSREMGNEQTVYELGEGL